MAVRHVLADLAAAAEDVGLPALALEAMGGVDVERRVASGEAVDLVFAASGALARLSADGHVDPASATPLVLSQVAVAVRDEGVAAADAPVAPGGAFATAFPDAAAVRAALAAAPRIGYSTGPSGTALLEKVAAWGMTDELDGRFVQARPGVPVARSLAAGEVALGFQQLSEFVGAPGVRILGVLPADCAIDSVFSGAVATASGDRAGAARLLAFFASDATAPLRLARSFSLPG